MPTDKQTRVYEAMFLVDTGDAAIWDDLTKHVEDILGRSGGELVGITRWDERKLAYPVGKHKRGTYILAFFHMSSGDGMGEIEHDCRLSAKIVRALVLKADHFTVADMRLQLGEDIREDVAKKVMDARGEKEPPPPEPEAGDEGAAETPATDAAPAEVPASEKAPAEVPASEKAPAEAPAPEKAPAEAPAPEKAPAEAPTDAEAASPEPPQSPEN